MSFSIRQRNASPAELRFPTLEAAKAYVKSRQLHVEIVQSGEEPNARLEGDELVVEPAVAKPESIPQPPSGDPDAPAPGHRKTVAESRAEEKERVAGEKADAKAEAKAEREERAAEKDDDGGRHVKRAPHGR